MEYNQAFENRLMIGAPSRSVISHKMQGDTEFHSSARETVSLRMDDVGAATKINEQYSKRWKGLGNFWKLKTLPGFRGWGPYPEMTVAQWEGTFRILADFGAKMTVGITAAWVESDGVLTPFPVKFPAQAAKIKEGMRAGLVEVANHGLTHCVMEGKRFLPRLFSSNRKFHREFWDWVPRQEHVRHMQESQDILQGYFQVPVTTFIPPGNVFCEHTLVAAKANGIRTVNCATHDHHSEPLPGLRVIGNRDVVAFHDRELVVFGLDWLRRLVASLPQGVNYRFVKEI